MLCGLGGYAEPGQCQSVRSHPPDGGLVGRAEHDGPVPGALGEGGGNSGDGVVVEACAALAFLGLLLVEDGVDDEFLAGLELSGEGGAVHLFETTGAWGVVVLVDGLALLASCLLTHGEDGGNDILLGLSLFLRCDPDGFAFFFRHVVNGDDGVDRCGLVVEQYSLHVGGGSWFVVPFWLA